jgi:protein-disulfide isomerase
MTKNSVQNPADSNAPATPRFDSTGLATLLGVVAMVALSLWNVWNLNRLGARVAQIETQIAGPTGPDPGRVYTVSTEGAYAKGPDSAPLTIVEFSDFQCPFCGRVEPTLKRIEDTYKGRVRIVWKHLPLASIHDNAVGAALAAEAAGRQGKFWEFHDRLFADQEKLGPDDLRQHARNLQLDMSRFEADVQNPTEKKKIEADVAEADALGVTSTPSIFINGRYLGGAQPFEAYAKVIDEELTKLNLPVRSQSSTN